MMKMTGIFSPAKRRTAEGGGEPEGAAAWKMRPGVMLVQKRNSDSEQRSVPISSIKVKVNYGSSSYLEFSISSQASFGELKKMVAGPTGVHHENQKMIFKDKEIRDSRTFLDVAGVKDGSKIVLIEDIIHKERRHLEMRRNATMDKASMEIAEISLEVDKFAKQVANLETKICGGKRVVEKVMLNLIEQLMTQLIKLDGIVADGDVKLRRRLQVKRVQKHIETLDMLKIGNSMIGNGAKIVPLQHHHQKVTNGKMQINTVQNQQEQQKKKRNSTGKMQINTVQNQQEQQKKKRNSTGKMQINTVQNQQEQQKKKRNSTGKMLHPVVVTTNWETFESKLPFTTSAPPVYYSPNNASYKRSWEYFV